MKHLIVAIILLILISCSSTQLVENWKNPNIDTYEPYKVLVVGLTSNIETRQKFENQLKNELELRGIETIMSLDFFTSSFRAEKLTENELKVLENNL